MKKKKTGKPEKEPDKHKELAKHKKVNKIDELLQKTGFQHEKKKILGILFFVSLILNVFLVLYVGNFYSLFRFLDTNSIILLVVLWIVGLIVITLLVFLIFFGALVMKAKPPKLTANKAKKVSAYDAAQKKKAPAKVSYFRHQKNLIEYIKKAGIDMRMSDLTKRIFKMTLFLTLISTVYLLFLLARVKPGFIYSLISTVLIWTVGFIGILFLIWTVFYVWIDLRIYNRTKKIEEVLPDFLHLTSANISAGMPIDRALWFAVRPNFGVLAKEIEDVAKSTIVGEKLETSLMNFAEKYDSVILKRSINLLLEGLESGGEIGDLLNRIAKNIEETRMIKKEMAANVTTYVIFIVFATVVAAPFLFGLSTELIVIMQTILGSIDLTNLDSGGSAGGMSMMFNVSGDTLSLDDYKTFVILCISVTCFFSAVIINIIKKGTVKEGLHYIPIFIAVSLIIYFIATAFLHSLLGGFF